MLISAQQICKQMRMALGVKISPRAVHVSASKLGYKPKTIGGKKGYDQSLYTALTRHLKDVVALQSTLTKKIPQKQNKPSNKASIGYYGYNGEKDNKDYDWEVNENIIRKVVSEAIDELDLFHGSQADFNEFDIAYMSSGWGSQAYGYGFYLTNDKETADSYARGGYVYTVKVPNGKYLSTKKIMPSTADRIARNFYHYYLTYDEYGKEAYKGCEKEFWDGECSSIGYAQDGINLYGSIVSILGDEKETSEYLHSIGYKGLKIYDKIHNGDTVVNYVIFDPKDIKILKKERI